MATFLVNGLSAINQHWARMPGSSGGLAVSEIKAARQWLITPGAIPSTELVRAASALDWLEDNWAYAGTDKVLTQAELQRVIRVNPRSISPTDFDVAANYIRTNWNKTRLGQISRKGYITAGELVVSFRNAAFPLAKLATPQQRSALVAFGQWGAENPGYFTARGDGKLTLGDIKAKVEPNLESPKVIASALSTVIQLWNTKLKAQTRDASLSIADLSTLINPTGAGKVLTVAERAAMKTLYHIAIRNPKKWPTIAGADKLMDLSTIKNVLQNHRNDATDAKPSMIANRPNISNFRPRGKAGPGRRLLEADPMPDNRTRIYTDTANSIAKRTVQVWVQFGYPGWFADTNAGWFRGSGFLMGDNKTVITAKHMIKGWANMPNGAQVLKVVVIPSSMTASSDGNKPPSSAWTKNSAYGISVFTKNSTNDLAVIALDRKLNVTAPAIPLVAMNPATINKAAAAGTQFTEYGFTAGNKVGGDSSLNGYLWQTRGTLTPVGTYNPRVEKGLAEGNVGSRNMYSTHGMSGGPQYVNNLQLYTSNGVPTSKASGITGLISGGTTNDAGGNVVSTTTSFTNDFVNLVDRVMATPLGAWYIPGSDEGLLEPPRRG